MPRIADYVVISDKLFELSKLKDGGFQVLSPSGRSLPLPPTDLNIWLFSSRVSCSLIYLLVVYSGLRLCVHDWQRLPK